MYVCKYVCMYVRNFGACPIVAIEGYWNFALCYLKKVRVYVCIMIV
jgi:hypothetical protein